MVSTPHSRNNPQSVTLQKGRMLFEMVKTCADVIGVLPKFLENLLGSENLRCSAAVGFFSLVHLIITALFFM